MWQNGRFARLSCFGGVCMSVVVVGTGQGGYQAAASLRGEGYQGPITLVGEEPHAPYQRPPLSKAYLLGKQDTEGLLLRPAAFYAENRIDTLYGETVTAIDRAARRVRLASGEKLAYEHLILATGARVRKLPIPGADLEGIVYLRTRDDSDLLRERLARADKIVVIGGGYVGLEIAAAARGFGKDVVVLEIEQRLMARSAAQPMSDFYADLHRERGVDLLLGTGAVKVEGVAGRVGAVLTSNGLRLAADLVVVGIGVVPNVEVAQAAGLAIGNGVAVDEFLRSSDPAIFAIGDACEFPCVHAGGARVRLESVQNAVDQARAVALTIMGKGAPYAAVPWFWTDQYEMKIQMAGLSNGFDQTTLRGDYAGGKFSLFYFRQGRMIAVDSVNRGADYMSVRKILGTDRMVTPAQIADEGFDLKALAR